MVSPSACRRFDLPSPVHILVALRLPWHCPPISHFLARFAPPSPIGRAIFFQKSSETLLSWGVQPLPCNSQNKYTRPRIGEQDALLLASRAESLRVPQEQYLSALIRADADRVRTHEEHTWPSLVRQLDRLAGAVVLLAAVQAELSLDIQSLQSRELEILRTVAAETEKLLAAAITP